MKLRNILFLSVAILILIGFLIQYMYPSRSITIATTTSLYATGFLDYIQERYNELDPNIVIKVIPLGSGAALETAARGDADIVFSHAPNLEKKYIDDGVLIEWGLIAYNYFIIVGPSDDPAGISNASNVVEAFRRIYQAGESGEAIFISRGDRSGTHVRELMIWEKAGLDPEGEWYIESGSGMGDTLLLANQLNAYTLSDIGTYTILSGKGRIEGLVKLFEEDDKLLNIYSIYLVSGSVDQDTMKFYNYIVDNISDLIREYNNLVGAEIFYPVESYNGDLEAMWIRFSMGDI